MVAVLTAAGRHLRLLRHEYITGTWCNGGKRKLKAKRMTRRRSDLVEGAKEIIYGL